MVKAEETRPGVGSLTTSACVLFSPAKISILKNRNLVSMPSTLFTTVLKEGFF